MRQGPRTNASVMQNASAYPKTSSASTFTDTKFIEETRYDRDEQISGGLFTVVGVLPLLVVAVSGRAAKAKRPSSSVTTENVKGGGVIYGAQSEGCKDGSWGTAAAVLLPLPLFPKIKIKRMPRMVLR